MTDKNLYFAHSNNHDETEWQLLKDHLTNTSKIAFELGQDAGVSDFSEIAGLFHDIGKYSREFQGRLKGCSGKVDHSTAGAHEIYHRYNQNQVERIISKILAYCIAGHHGGLVDSGSPIDTEEDITLQGRLKRKIADYSSVQNEFDFSQIGLPNKIPIRPITRDGGFSLSFFTRMIYSALVDADFQDTETFMNQRSKPRGGYQNLEYLLGNLQTYLLKFRKPVTDIEIKRNETLAQCVANSDSQPGFFRLTVPTGGGKTLSSMSFALRHAIANKLKRVIYVIPYTTIIEQNAAIFKEALGNDVVLEHHSNLDLGRKRSLAIADQDSENDVLSEKIKLAAENWDIPITVTTNVQFFESIYSNRSSRCRKLHNLAKSVIILDEAQMLPVEFLTPCIFALSELVENYGSSVVFCTATQPPLERFFPKQFQIKNLVEDTQELFDFYKRVRIENLGTISDNLVASGINQNSQALCVVNTRRHAKKIFDLLDPEDSYHLSTLMCSAHRKQKISEIKERLCSGKSCRVISTQLIEAGVDISFPLGYRSLAGIDSIIQVAGRVNRENENNEGGILYIFEPDDMNENQIPAEIRQRIHVARNILRKYSDPICPQAVLEFYNLLYDLQDENAADAKKIISCFENGIPLNTDFDFRLASEKFQLINQPTIPVIVKYDDKVVELLEQIKHSEFPKSYSRSLQPYTINLFEKQFLALQSNGFIDTYNDCFDVLNSQEQYDPETGLLIPENDETRMIAI